MNALSIAAPVKVRVDPGTRSPGPPASCAFSLDDVAWRISPRSRRRPGNPAPTAARRPVARDEAAHLASEPPGSARRVARGATLVARVAAPPPPRRFRAGFRVRSYWKAYPRPRRFCDPPAPRASRADLIIPDFPLFSPPQARGVTARKASALSARSAVASAPVSAVVGAAPASRGALSVVAANPRGNSGGSRKGLAKFVERVNTPQMKDDLIPFRVGMTVKVGVTVVEGGKSRVQPYEGIVIAIHRAGVATTITVRKSFQGYGVERIFPIHSPLCSFEEVRGAGKPVARRAKLYYLRNLVGKKAKLKTRFVAKKTGPTRHQLKMEALAATKAAAAAEAEKAAAAEAAAAAAAEAADAPAEEAAAEPEA